MAIHVTSALAVSTNVVRVTLSAEPQHLDSAADGDALNPATWTVRRADLDLEFNVIGASMVDATHFDVLTYEPFGPYLVVHEASSSNLLAADGVTVISSPTLAQFAGVVDGSLSTPEALAAQRRLGTRDLSNPPAPAGLGSISGTMSIGPGGDYVNDYGTDLIRKLIIRRLSLKKKDLFWAPDYGEGIDEKEPIPPDLLALVSDMERGLAQEPEIDAVRVNIVVDPQGIVVITVRATLKQTGQQVSVSYSPQGVG